MRISDWSSDVCSSDLLDLLSRRDAKAARCARTLIRPCGAPSPASGRRAGVGRGIRCRPPIKPGRVTMPACDHGCDSDETLVHRRQQRSEEHTSELQSLMRISYAVFCLKKKKTTQNINIHNAHINTLENKIDTTPNTDT